MADFDPIGEHDKPDEGKSERPDENIPLNSGRAMGGSTWESEREQDHRDITIETKPNP